jgi:hypothetical protein
VDQKDSIGIEKPATRLIKKNEVKKMNSLPLARRVAEGSSIFIPVLASKAGSGSGETRTSFNSYYPVKSKPVGAEICSALSGHHDTGAIASSES